MYVARDSKLPEQSLDFQQVSYSILFPISSGQNSHLHFTFDRFYQEGFVLPHPSCSLNGPSDKR